jgi:hypothetical protein
MPDPVDPNILPPPGHARRETLKRRMDRLTEEAERLAAESGMERIDEAKLKAIAEDREVRQQFVVDANTGIEDVPVSNKQPGYRYVWVWRDPYNRLGGRIVFSYLRDGYEIVRGDMPEAQEYRSVTGERWAADAMLLRIRQDVAERLDAQRRARRLALEGQTAREQAEELSARFKRRITAVTEQEAQDLDSRRTVSAG